MCMNKRFHIASAFIGVAEPLELEPFLALEPPMSASDYGFCLDYDEGLAELFDFDF